MIIEYCEKCTIRIDAACYMDPQSATKYCHKCGTNNPALVPFDPNEKPNSGKSSGTRVKTPSGTRLKATSGTKLKSLSESPATQHATVTNDNSKPPESFNKHVGNMAFYFCETCGRRISEVDLSQGLAKNKQLKGVYCASCSVGVNTMEMDAINIHEVLGKTESSTAKLMGKSAQSPHTSHVHKPSPGIKKKISSSPILFPALPLVTVAIVIVVIILMSKSTDDSSANANPKKSVPPQSTLVAEADVAKKNAEQESANRAAEEKAALELARKESKPLEPGAAVTPPVPAASPDEAPTAQTLAAREEQAMKEMQELRDQREAKRKEAQANAVNTPPLVPVNPTATTTLQVEINWTPKGLKPAVWYDASDASTITQSAGAVSQWNDKSGNGYHATQGTGAAQPTTGTQTLNGLNVIAFDGGDKLVSTFTLSGDRSAYVVFKHNTSGDSFVMDNRATTSAATFFATSGKFSNWNGAGIGFGAIATNTNPHFRDFIISGTLGSTYHDGAVDSTLNPVGAKSMNGLSIGARYSAGASLNGYIGEIILCAQAHDTAARQKVEGYLAHKWGLTANLPADHPYKTTPPQNK